MSSAGAARRPQPRSARNRSRSGADLGALAARLPARAGPARRRRRRVLRRRQRRSQCLVSLKPDQGARWPRAFLPLAVDSWGASVGRPMLGAFPSKGPPGLGERGGRAAGRPPGSAALPVAAGGRGPGGRRMPGCAEPARAARGGRAPRLCGTGSAVSARTGCPPPAGAPPPSSYTPGAGQDRDSGQEGGGEGWGWEHLRLRRLLGEDAKL